MKGEMFNGWISCIQIFWIIGLIIVDGVDNNNNNNNDNASRKRLTSRGAQSRHFPLGPC